MLPEFNKNGFLPEGVWDCDFNEFAKRFAIFRRSERRLKLFENLEELLKETVSTGWVQEIIIDGSYVTGKDEPGDIDLILVLFPEYDEIAVPFWASRILNAGYLSRKYRFDVKIEPFGSIGYRKYIDFFQKVTDSDERKGVVRLTE
jgi:hypothetical protein